MVTSSSDVYRVLPRYPLRISGNDIRLHMDDRTTEHLVYKRRMPKCLLSITQLFRIVLLLGAIAGIDGLRLGRRQSNGCNCAGMLFDVDKKAAPV